MFGKLSDHSVEVMTINHSDNIVTSRNKLKNVDCQTPEDFLPQKEDVETITNPDRKDIATTSSGIKLQTAEYDETKLQKFLIKAQPIMMRELQPNPAYQYLIKNYGNNEINQISETETDSKYSVSSISTNCTGSSVAVALKLQNHYGFCRHSSNLYFVSTVNGTSRTYQLESCATAVVYHPHYPAIIAIGHHTGEVKIIKSEELWGSTGLSEEHDDEIVALDWIQEKQSVSALVSASIGGTICVWILKNRNSKTKKLENPSSIRVFEKGGLISSLKVIPGSCDALVGLHSGKILRIPLPYESKTIIQGTRKFYYGHTGPVSGISICKSAPGLFISVGTDEQFCIRNIVNEQPLLSCEIAGKELHDIKWNPFSPSIVAVAATDTLLIVDLLVSTSSAFITKNVPGAIKVSWNESVRGMIIVGCNDGRVVIFSCDDGSLDEKPGSNRIVMELEAKTKPGLLER